MTQMKQIIGYDDQAAGEKIFYATDPVTLQHNPIAIYKATQDEVNLAVEKAALAFQVYRKKSGSDRAAFLEAIAAEIEMSSELIPVCVSETGLPVTRLEGERSRTINQLRMFGALLKEGSWVDARIETAMPERLPVPKPDLRFMYTALGPVAVFGASNFPLAFSVAGGDTASALAAGCPVIVKAHPAHPATSGIVGKAIQTAARKTNMPDGVFSLLFDDGIEIGMQLVRHPLIKAVGFTGSFRGGKAIYDAAVRREEPIPVYAEMGSSNPVFILPKAAKEKGRSIADGYAASVTLGVGQFCTNPGMFIYRDPDADLMDSLKTAFEKTTGGVMLAPYILNAYNEGLSERQAVPGVAKIAAGSIDATHSETGGVPLLLSASADLLKRNPALSEEIFGPSGIVIATHTSEEMLEIARGLSGQLTVTIHGSEEDFAENKELLDILEQKAGRIVFNAFPTGVEVCTAMVHGGPFPATTDSRTTSVGTAAIYRFVRPVCYQNMPQAFLPAALQNENAGGIWRMVNGVRDNGKLQ